MPSYFYHLKLELYPSSTPTQSLPKSPRGDFERDIWLPPAEASIFDDLPSHPRPDRPARFALPKSNSYQGSSQAEKIPTSAGASTSQQQRAVLDCGLSRAPDPNGDEGTRATQKLALLPRHSLGRNQSFPPPSFAAAIRPETAVQDWRFGRVSIETLDLRGYESGMSGESSGNNATPGAAPGLGPTFPGSGAATRAELRFPDTKNTEVGWGVVHFYRDGDETPGLDARRRGEEGLEGEAEVDGEEPVQDCNTLCIPAVPAYMSPGDFWGFVGERWRDDISHCRIVVTSQMNRYLALLRFRSGERAKEWKTEFDGKVFNTMESQTCHVVFIKSITFETVTNLPPDQAVPSSSAAVSASLKPFPPPTPSLVELPTCPVCLERMDETNGLMTIPCSHVFHCTCLQNWKGSGCPVCRFTNTSQGGADYDPHNPYTHPFGSSISNLCSVCDCTDDLWICLICGYVGCGRYKGGHAKDHWKETAHSFALELETQHVWDYAGDMWVHRLIRDKGDGKVVELPGRNDQRLHRQEEEDVVPRAKMESIGLEYTHLITSQLESQRAYYEEMLSKAATKASNASAAAEKASLQAALALEKLEVLDAKYRALTVETIPELERDLSREKNKASKSEALARNFGSTVQEEKRINEGLMKRIEHLEQDNQGVRKTMEELRVESEELKEMNRDLSMFISGQQKLKELEQEGDLEEGEVEGGTAGVVEKKSRRRKKK